MFVYPLSSQELLNEAVSVANLIKPNAMSAMKGFISVGQGIASLFILFVIFYYVTSILDGGKFQMKMLWPLGLYMLICSFGSTVSPLTISFTNALRNGLTESCQNVQGDFYKTYGQGATYLDVIIKSTYGSHNNQDMDKLVEMLVNGYEQSSGHDENGDFYIATTTMPDSDGKIVHELKKFWIQIKWKLIEALHKPSFDAGSGWPFPFAGSAIMFLIGKIIDIIAMALAVVMTCYGVVSMYILLAFGPVTWAFALFPGNGKVLGSWFIRLSQFTLYGPVALLIRTFCMSICVQIVTSGKASLPGVGASSGGFSYILLFTVLLCCIIALINVPTICSFIIEGASGAVSMMGGVGTLFSATSMVMDAKQLKNQQQILGNQQAAGGGGSPAGGGSGRSGGPTP